MFVLPYVVIFVDVQVSPGGSDLEEDPHDLEIQQTLGSLAISQTSFPETRGRLHNNNNIVQFPFSSLFQDIHAQIYTVTIQMTFIQFLLTHGFTRLKILTYSLRRRLINRGRVTHMGEMMNVKVLKRTAVLLNLPLLRVVLLLPILCQRDS